MNSSETDEVVELRRTILQMQAVLGVALIVGGAIFGIMMTTALWWLGPIVLVALGMMLWGSITRLKVALEELYWAQANADDDPHPRAY